MLLRAVFWIGLVALLMPHEPDIGLGRPGTPAVASDALAVASAAVTAPGLLCSDHAVSCAEGLAALRSLQGIAVQRLEQVRADIETQQRFRAH